MLCLGWKLLTLTPKVTSQVQVFAKGQETSGASHPELGDNPQKGMHGVTFLLHFLASAPSSSLSKPPPFAKSSKSLLPIPAPHFLWPGSLQIKFWSRSEDTQVANPCVQTLLAKATGITVADSGPTGVQEGSFP